MKKRILSICLSLTILAASGMVSGAAAKASETAGEGATTAETVPEQAEENEADVPEQSSGQAIPDQAEEASDVPTDAAGNVITPETAEAIENADMGVTDMEKIADPDSAETEAAGAADGAEEAIQTPEESGTEMDKSTIGAAFDAAYQFNKEDAIVFVREAAAVKAEPSDDAEDIASIDRYYSIHLTGSNGLKYWEVRVGGTIGYIDSSLIVWDEGEVEALKADDARREENEAQSKQDQEDLIVEKTSEAKDEWTAALKETRREELANQTRSLNWSGPVLSRSKGSVYGPSGKETYYNLNMSGCVRNMNRRGYYYDVWVRNDGCKMFGDYIMCAANLGVHPFGSLVECSLGTCIVVDTGGFAAGNPHQLDIAVTW